MLIIDDVFEDNNFVDNLREVHVMKNASAKRMKLNMALTIWKEQKV